MTTELTTPQAWARKTDAQRLEHLRQTECELRAVQRQIPELAERIHQPVGERAWNALTDEQRFACIIELEMQRENCRSYVNTLCRAHSARLQPAGAA